MNLTNLLTLFVGIVSLITPILLLIKAPKLYRNRILFFLALVSGPFWAFSIVMFYMSASLEYSIIYLNLIYTVSVLTSIITFEFTRIYPYTQEFLLKDMVVLFGPAIFILYKLWFSSDFIISLEYINNQKTPVLGYVYMVWFIWFAFIIGSRLYVLFKKLRSVTEIGKKQTVYIMIGLAIAGLGIIPTNMLLPYFGNYNYIWAGPFMSAIMISVIGYAVSTLRFFNMKKSFLKFYKIFIYLLLPSFLFGSLVSLFLLKRVDLDLRDFLLIILLPLVSSLFSLLLRRLIKEEKFSLKDELAASTESELDIRQISESFASISIENFHVESFSFFLYNEDQKKIFSYDSGRKILVEEFPLVEVISFGGYYKDREKLIVLQELKHLQLTSLEEQNMWKYKRFLNLIGFLNRNRIGVIVPIFLRGNLSGYVCLGFKKDDDLFKKEDIDNLIEIKVPLKVVFERAILYQEVQTFNQTLQQKVDDQTKELQVKIKELEEARRKERDMIDIMGHELRTPATIVKLNVELLEKYIDSNPEEFKKYVDRIKGAIENEIKLINTLLSSAKLEGNRVEINKEKVDIVSEIDMSIHGHEKVSEDKGVRLVNHTDPNTPNIYADKARTVEILNNLIDNGIKYTQEGSVTVDTEYDNDFVKVTVTDTGKGIPKEEIPKLGQKFHRIDNYLESNKNLDIVRPGGTGLGLFVTFRLVELMGGKIWVESELGVGSKFIFTFPIYKDQKESKQIDSKNMFEKLGLKR